MVFWFAIVALYLTALLLIHRFCFGEQREHSMVRLLLNLEQENCTILTHQKVINGYNYRSDKHRSFLVLSASLALFPHKTFAGENADNIRTTSVYGGSYWSGMPGNTGYPWSILVTFSWGGAYLIQICFKTFEKAFYIRGADLSSYGWDSWKPLT